MTNGEHKEGRVPTTAKEPSKPSDQKKPQAVADAAASQGSQAGAKK